jgi:hypothetical protein
LNVSLTPNIESKESINDVTICDELTVEQKQQLVFYIICTFVP